MIISSQAQKKRTFFWFNSKQVEIIWLIRKNRQIFFPCTFWGDEIKWGPWVSIHTGQTGKFIPIRIYYVFL